MKFADFPNGESKVRVGQRRQRNRCVIGMTERLSLASPPSAGARLESWKSEIGCRRGTGKSKRKQAGGLSRPKKGRNMLQGVSGAEKKRQNARERRFLWEDVGGAYRLDIALLHRSEERYQTDRERFSVVER